jgi:hypothetical protein
MAEEELTKVDAAKRLLDRGMELFLDDGDDLSALVLGGSAEDILEGLLVRQRNGQTPARRQMAKDAATALGFDQHSHGWKAVVEDMWRYLRREFNWTRHADRLDDPMTLKADWHDEALWALDRASENLQMLTGEEHPRWQEVIAMMLGRNTSHPI